MRHATSASLESSSTPAATPAGTPSQPSRTPLTQEELSTLLRTPIVIADNNSKRYYQKQSTTSSTSTCTSLVPSITSTTSTSSSGRQEGSLNYSNNDTEILLDIIESIKPVGNQLWAQVEIEYNANPNVEVCM